ncbi:MAG: MerR family transcriptional regulator [Bacteroidales bacterium]|nr:MerR family transcriptional regulator [Bacteroidales bacterium]
MENNKLYYSIGEVAQMLGEAPSVLRFWETEFDCIRPVKNRRGSRSYTKHDIDLLRRIQYLTRQCGYTLEGAREQMRQRPVDDAKMEIVRHLQEVRSFLVDLKETL